MISDPLNGMFWDIGIDFQIPYFGDTEKVVEQLQHPVRGLEEEMRAAGQLNFN